MVAGMSGDAWSYAPRTGQTGPADSLPGYLAVPVIGVVTSAIALHEPLGPGQIAALAFTLAGVALATKS
jgi:drug/metabolite transporter (DMT)-like permease